MSRTTEEQDKKRRKLEEEEDVYYENEGIESTIIRPFPNPSQCVNCKNKFNRLYRSNEETHTYTWT
jgi:hypothetical protein